MIDRTTEVQSETDKGALEGESTNGGSGTTDDPSKDQEAHSLREDAFGGQRSKFITQYSLGRRLRVMMTLAALTLGLGSGHDQVEKPHTQSSPEFRQPTTDEEIIRALLDRLDPAGRRSLTGEEKKLLEGVFGESLDLDQIQIQTVPESLNFLMSGHQCALLDTILVAPGDTLGNKRLIHEAEHIRQYQETGTQYIHEALSAMIQSVVTTGSRLGAYAYGKALYDGATWDDLNPEQKATLIHNAYQWAYFDYPQTELLVNSEGKVRWVLGVPDELGDWKVVTDVVEQAGLAAPKGGN